MTKRYAAALLLACLLGSLSPAMLAQDSRSVLSNASRAMGADNLKTIQIAATGSHADIGQNANPKTAWPVMKVKSYSREVDFDTMASHVRFVRVQNGIDQTQDQYSAADSPWDSQFSYWLNPLAFVKGAVANNAAITSETVNGVKYNVVTFSLQGRYKVVGYINEQNVLERVQTWIDNDVLGDMLAEAWYSVYKDFGGVKFPTLIIEKRAGFPALILAVSDVKPNAAVSIQPQRIPATPSPLPSPSVAVEKIADGVLYLKGGTHHSVAVEFADHVAVIEAPVNEQRSLAVIGEVKRLIPNKPIRYVLNTHHHFDHSGGLRAYVAEGATVVTHEGNKEFFEKAFATPRTVSPDRLAQSQRKAVIETVTDKKVLSDNVRTLEVYLVKDNPHADGILMGFLPKEKILIEADVLDAPTPQPNNRAAANFADNVEKLKLDFETILPLDGARALSRSDLYAAIVKPVPDIKVLLAQTPPPAQEGQRGQRGQAAAGQTVQASDDAGRQILETACTTCHNLNRVQNKSLAQSDWQIVIDRMKGRGAELPDDSASVLLNYLVKAYGPKQ
jgi:glyoxylase-like metal-dependent hydrolase (beta-lactamase superfamily II)